MPVAPDDVLGEEAAGPQLRYAHCDVAHACDQVVLAVAVAAVGVAGARLVCFSVHDGAHDVLGEMPYELPRLDQLVLEPRHRGLRGHAFC